MQLWVVLLFAYIVSAIVVCIPPLSIYNKFEQPSWGANSTAINMTILANSSVGEDGSIFYNGQVIDNETMKLLRESMRDQESGRDKELEGSAETDRLFFYLLVLPGFAVLNGILVYILHYRHLRGAVYRQEKRLAENHNLLERYEELCTNGSLSIMDGTASSISGGGCLGRSFARSIITRPCSISHLDKKQRPRKVGLNETTGIPCCNEVRFAIERTEQVLNSHKKLHDELQNLVDTAEADAVELARLQQQGESSVGVLSPVTQDSRDPGSFRGSMRLYGRPHPKADAFNKEELTRGASRKTAAPFPRGGTASPSRERSWDHSPLGNSPAGNSLSHSNREWSALKLQQPQGTRSVDTNPSSFNNSFVSIGGGDSPREDQHIDKTSEPSTLPRPSRRNRRRGGAGPVVTVVDLHESGQTTPLTPIQIAARTNGDDYTAGSHRGGDGQDGSHQPF